MPTATTTKPRLHLTFGRSLAPVVHETWYERCEEFGCRCIRMEQDTYAEVEVLAEAEDTADSYANALHVAERTIALGWAWAAEEPPAADYVVRYSVSDGTGQNFVCSGWSQLDAARADLLSIAKEA